MDDQKTATPTPQDLDKMGYAELREEAKKKNINYSGLNVTQLKFALGAAPEGAIVVDLKEGMSESMIKDLMEKKKLVPGKIIYTKSIEDNVWRVREKNPVAFDNVNFTDKEALIQHTFTKKTKCSCGESVTMERWITVKKDKTFIDKVDEDAKVFKKQCTCGKWYIYHPKEDAEIHGPVL